MLKFGSNFFKHCMPLYYHTLCCIFVKNGSFLICESLFTQTLNTNFLLPNGKSLDSKYVTDICICIVKEPNVICNSVAKCNSKDINNIYLMTFSICSDFIIALKHSA